jgi:glycosyltransferase involved in cell wall biosynthesis
MRVLFLSHTALGGTFVVGSHHLSKAMARMGHQVVHLSPPITPAHLLLSRESFQRARIRRWWRCGEIVDGVRDVVPASILPWNMARCLSQRPHELFAMLTSGSAMRQLKGQQPFRPDIVFIDEPRLAGLTRRFCDARIIYRPTDLYAQIRRDSTVVVAERYLVQRADKFIATSEPVAAHLRSLGATNILLLENGVDLEHFKPEPEVVNQRDPRMAVYVGAMDRRFGYDSIIAAATENPELTFLLLGPVYEEGLARLRHLKNVSLHGAVRFSELPLYLRKASVALLPLSDDPANQGRSPMKLFEYAAAGLPVVATATQELLRRNLPFVALAHSPAEFARTVGDWAAGRLALSDGQVEAVRHSWISKSVEALNFALS